MIQYKNKVHWDCLPTLGQFIISVVDHLLDTFAEFSKYRRKKTKTDFLCDYIYFLGPFLTVLSPQNVQYTYLGLGSTMKMPKSLPHFLHLNVFTLSTNYDKQSMILKFDEKN